MHKYVWIQRYHAETVHYQMIQGYGGSYGLRSEDLLLSALARAQQMRAYNPDADMFSLAAQYAGGIIQNHPFIDGNKRTASYLALLFLRLNGMEGVHVRLPDLFKAVLDLATHKIDEEGFATVLRSATRLTTD